MKKYKIIVYALLMLTCCISVSLYWNRERSGTVESLSQLPICGAAMPQLDCKEFKYLYIPNRGVLFCKASSGKQGYDKLCEHFKLKTVEYSANFPKQEFDGVDPFYVPLGDSLSFGYGNLFSDERTLIRVCWEQTENSLDASGQLYVYILDR